ncbi:MAG: hypothetical protein U0871_25730 [Gemmataceae bacterium]
MRKRLVLFVAVVVWAAGVGAGWLFLPSQPLAEWSLPDDCQVVALLPGTHTLVTAYKMPVGYLQRGPIELWDIDTGTKTGSYPGPAERFSIYGGNTGTDRPNRLLHLILYDSDRVTDDSRLLGSCLIDAATGREVRRSAELNLHSIPPGDSFAVGRTTADGPWTDLFAAADGRPLGSLPGAYFQATGDGRFVMTTRGEPGGRTLTVWQADSGQPVGTVPVPDVLWRVKVAADGRTLVTDAGEVWDVPAGTVRYTVDAATALTPDGRGLLVGRRDGDRVRFRRHDLATGEPDPGRGFAVPYKASPGGRPHFGIGPGDRLYVFGESADQADTAPGWWGRPKTTRILNRCQVLDLATGRRLLTVDGCQLVGITADGERLVYRYQDGVQLGPLTVWAIPPGPPVGRLAALAAGWAAVVGLAAWRLSRLARRPAHTQMEDRP